MAKPLAAQLIALASEVRTREHMLREAEMALRHVRKIADEMAEAMEGGAMTPGIHEYAKRLRGVLSQVGS